jgi:hypothetical protein
MGSLITADVVDRRAGNAEAIRWEMMSELSLDVHLTISFAAYPDTVPVRLETGLSAITLDGSEPFPDLAADADHDPPVRGEGVVGAMNS